MKTASPTLLISCFRPSSSPRPVPAQAQESGEHRQLLDAAWYALDGLQPCVSEAMQCDSALTFAEMAATGRGRLALRWGCTCMQACLNSSTQPWLAPSCMRSIDLLAVLYGHNDCSTEHVCCCVLILLRSVACAFFKIGYSAQSAQHVAHRRRSDGILQEALAKAAALPLQQRPTLALVLAALLASFSRQAADQAVLAAPESAALLKELVLVRAQTGPAGVPPPAKVAGISQACITHTLRRC